MDMNMKEQVGKEIAMRVEDGDLLGVGTGSTVDAALRAIEKRVAAEGLNIAVVPSSYQTAMNCQQIGLKTLSPLFDGELSWGFDGADEVDSKLRLIKGRGGAMLQEKILAAKCKKFIVIVDESKMVDKLGSTFKIPVEIIPEALSLATKGLQALGAKDVTLRKAEKKHGPVITEQGNFILDLSFDEITDVLESQMNSVLGVVENGLFTDCVDEVLVAQGGEVRSILK